jgi:hypothetical protein
MATRIANRDTQTENILTEIFGATDLGVNTSRDDFNKYFDAYTKGQYLITRDWQTGIGANATIATDAETAFLDAVHAIPSESGFPQNPNTYNNGRGTIFNNIGNGVEFGGLLVNLSAEMKTQIIDALGVTGKDNAESMASALITQFGDNEEFRAFVDDLQAEGLTTALNYDYSNAIPEVSKANSQSDTKLASVKGDVKFAKGIV